MSKSSRFTFSLLRILLSMAAMGAVLAIGRWWDAPLGPIIVTAAAAGLLMFVIQWRHVPSLILEGLCAVLGIGIASLFAPAVRPPRTEYTDLTYAVSGALIGWFVACCWVRSTSVDRRLRAGEPPADAIEVGPLDSADRALEDPSRPPPQESS